MIGVPFIVELFTNIFKQSKVMQGNFFVAPQWGSGVDTGALENLEEMVDLGEKENLANLVVMMPPAMTTKSRAERGAKKGYDLSLLFLTQSQVNADRMVKVPRTDIPSLSAQRVINDWHTMEGVATDFVRVLDTLIISKGLAQHLIFSGMNEESIKYLTTVGKAKYNGVRLQLEISLNAGCGIGDYNNDFLDNIQIPQ